MALAVSPCSCSIATKTCSPTRLRNALGAQAFFEQFASDQIVVARTRPQLFDSINFWPILLYRRISYCSGGRKARWYPPMVNTQSAAETRLLASLESPLDQANKAMPPAKWNRGAKTNDRGDNWDSNLKTPLFASNVQTMPSSTWANFTVASSAGTSHVATPNMSKSSLPLPNYKTRTTLAASIWNPVSRAPAVA